VDGLVAAIAFGCAPDSGLAPVLAQEAQRAGIPMLTLTLDEQSGEAGLMTRLEAFVDMVVLRKQRGVGLEGRDASRSAEE
jgi:predicted nucleotide-binding protein (sugar kinase/HSP70/actin superfamily)